MQVAEVKRVGCRDTIEGNDTGCRNAGAECRVQSAECMLQW
jgi:hypothetical protein